MLAFLIFHLAAYLMHTKDLTYWHITYSLTHRRASISTLSCTTELKLQHFPRKVVTFSTDASVPREEEQRWYCLSVCLGGFSGASECTALSMHFSLVVLCDSLVNTCLNLFLFKLPLCSVFELAFQISVLNITIPYLLKFFFFLCSPCWSVLWYCYCL